MEHTTVKELVDKHKSIEQKKHEIFNVLSGTQGRDYHATEVIERAAKDQRYPVQLMVQEYKRLTLDLEELEATPVRFLRD